VYVILGLAMGASSRKNDISTQFLASQASSNSKSLTRSCTVYLLLGEGQFVGDEEFGKGGS